MKIVIDENIPYARLFNYIGEIQFISGRLTSWLDISDADALIVRSVTKVDKTLLEGTSVKFVGTTTAGTDHVDETWLRKVGIKFSSAPGSNAVAVVEYVFSALLALAERDGFALKDRTLGIVGVGNIGRLLQERLKVLEIRTLLCDPPRVDKGEVENFLPLKTLVEQVDILTLHTPLLRDGPYKTFHLVDGELIKNLKPGSILINTCRGSVVDNSALLTCLEAGQKLSVVLDVWEEEPDLNISLLRKIDIGTPHIAGYTVEGKARATTQIFNFCSDFFGKSRYISLSSILSTPKIDSVNLHGTLDEPTLKRLIHFIYDVRRDDAILRKIAEIPGEFDKLRKNYFERREWSSLYITCDNENTSTLLYKLGFNSRFY